MAEIAPITLQITINITALAHAEPAAGGYSAEVPALPGCYTQAETLEDLRLDLFITHISGERLDRAIKVSASGVEQTKDEVTRLGRTLSGLLHCKEETA